MAESNADVYASLGANPLVTTSGDVLAHEQNMLELNVQARDGDDAIDLNFDEPEDNNDDPYAFEDKFADEHDPNRMQVRISSDGEEQTVDGEVDDQAVEGQEGDSEFTPLGEPDDALVDAINKMADGNEGFEAVMQKAVENGLTEDAIAKINTEYLSGDGLSEASYEALAAAGYDRNFVNTYIAGQEAGIKDYVEKVWQYAGGQEKFQTLYAHLEATNAEAATALENALNSGDVATIKAIVNLAGASHTKKFGKPQERTITTQARPAPVVKQEEGYESQAAMIKDMSDPRYRHDSKFRAEVERKVGASRF